MGLAHAGQEEGGWKHTTAEERGKGGGRDGLGSMEFAAKKCFHVIVDMSNAVVSILDSHE